MRIDRIWAMPNRWTFSIKPIRELLEDEKAGEGLWIDPFYGECSPVDWEYSNDANPEIDSRYHEDALKWLQGIRGNWADGIIYDPPFSITKARMYGRKEYSSMAYWASCKNEIARITKLGGKVICCGWTSGGLGKNRGFKLKRVLLVPHGGSRNDTIITVEIKEKQ